MPKVACGFEGCAHEAMNEFVRLDCRRPVFEKLCCEAHFRDCFGTVRSMPFVGFRAQFPPPGAVCVDVEIASYHRGPEKTPGCLYLREVGGDRGFRMLVTADVYWEFVAEVRQVVSRRPFTHAAWVRTIEALGGRVQEVILDCAHDSADHFDATLRVVRDGCAIDLNIESGDSHILAVVAHVPIFAVEGGMRRALGRKGGW